MRFSLADAPGKDSYPISGATWVVFFTRPSGAQTTLTDFLRWAIHDGQGYADKLNYAPLPPELVERIDKKMAALK
jgi:phosphate transport system substrate-binding protein